MEMLIDASREVSSEARRAISLISAWPVVRLGDWPTPIQVVDHPQLNQLMVKRDDLAGFGRSGTSGVKARKLEGFLSHVLRSGCNEVIVLLANMTNLGHDLVPALARMGVRSRMLIVDNPILPLTERELLFQDISQSVELLGPSQSAGFVRLLLAKYRSGREGLNPIALLPSPGHPSAVIGAARGLLEAVEQIHHTGQVMPSVLFLATAAGTTLAGFHLASSLLRAAGIATLRIVAVPVVPYRVEYWLPFLLWSARKTLGLRASIPGAELKLMRIPRNLTFGRFDGFLEGVCTRVRDSFGFSLDPIYGAKSWSAMEEYGLTQGDSSQRFMFWHCGYSPDWEAFRTRPLNGQ